MNEMNEAENNKIINYLNEENAELNKKDAEFSCLLNPGSFQSCYFSQFHQCSFSSQPPVRRHRTKQR